MANRTIDRRKAGSARSQAAKATKKPEPKPARPGAGKGDNQSSLKLEKTARSGKAETLEIEESETDELALDEEGEVEEEEVVDQAEVDEEEEEEKKPAKRRSPKKERDLVELIPQDYSISRPSGGKSRLLDKGPARFVRSAYRELRLVTWPSRRDTWNWSLVVIGVCIAVAALLGAADIGLSKFVQWWVSLSQH
jgi:preprotein translocase subunit SecE